MAAPVRFELTHSLHCLTDFKSAPLNRLGTAPEYKKATVPYKTAAFVPEDRCKSVRFKCFSPYMSARQLTPLMSGVKLTQLIEKQS